MTRDDVFYSNGICPMCGYTSRSTVCDVEKGDAKVHFYLVLGTFHIWKNKEVKWTGDHF